jgi:hypothetical protein
MDDDIINIDDFDIQKFNTEHPSTTQLARNIEYYVKEMKTFNF